MSRSAPLLLAILLMGCGGTPDKGGASSTSDDGKVVKPEGPRPRLGVLASFSRAEAAGLLNLSVGAKGEIVLRTIDNVYDVGSEANVFDEPLRGLAAVCLAGGRLYWVAEGELRTQRRKLLDVPLGDVKLAPAKQGIYVAGTAGTGEPGIYLVRPGVGFHHLLAPGMPVDALASVGARLYFSSGPALFTLVPDGKLEAVAVLPTAGRIRSFAVDSEHPVVYLSDGLSLDALHLPSGAFTSISRELGGKLRFANGRLYVLSAQDSSLYQLEGLYEALEGNGFGTPVRSP